MGLYVEGMLFTGVLVEWKITKRKKGKDHKKVKEKALGQLVVKERNGGRMVVGGQEGDNKNR